MQGLAHCGACHTPRAVTMPEQWQDESHPSFLSGGELIDGWLAVNLRANPAAGLGRWSQQDIVDTLATSRNAHSAVMGSPMNEVVAHSPRHMGQQRLLRPHDVALSASHIAAASCIDATKYRQN